MRGIFARSAKRNFTVGKLLLLTAVLSSVFLPGTGFTFDGVKQIEFAVKNPRQVGPNGSALWVTNLGTQNTKLTLGTKPFVSTVAQEIAGGQTVRLDNSLPASFRGSDTLFIRSREEVATLIAPVDFPVRSSEFYSSPSRQADGRPQAVPKWVRELGAIGKTGNNVFQVDGTGYAPAVKGQTEPGKRYAFGVGVAFSKANSSVEFNLISRAGQTIKSLILSSSKGVYWQSELGEFMGGTDDYPSRIEMKVLAGTAQGFLSLKDAESGEALLLPIAPFVAEGSLEAGSAEEQDLFTHSGKGGPMLSEESSRPVQGGAGGYAYFSNGVYDSRFSSYTYNVYSAPPNVCGTLYIVRNGNPESTGGWICTNGSGQATKGPWTGSTNQTGQSIYIQWPNGTTTVGGDYKVDDGSDPSIWSIQTPGIGVAIPNQFSGGGSDVQWGTGFNFAPYGWSPLTGRFRQITNPNTPQEYSRYYDGSGYFSTFEVYFPGTSTPPAGGYSINWAVNSPPQSIHNSADTYEWCVFSQDLFYPCFNCIYFVGPR